ncbi:elongation factor G [Bifidobacterium bombi]|uniref:Translation elongation factors G n=1 Tax=Bifidobacterium bombi DSM 19703 TaxID=1341695 RepID=A0A080N427_9BIFI|nr:TetM/TetW/TetO/TetS family tetracycline resistance ribosomal protection protein [Bifidobacterium bombi]KFF30995.1 translation elongation factors G [Bifidobacterium bombi DSM 19703]
MDDKWCAKRITVGVLAHVDAGKTTLCEAMLYRSGEIRRLGRVDDGDAFLDTDAMERNRGITIFSKNAVVHYGGMEMTLLDTPGHVDFAAETERTLAVLDYAIVVVSAADGVQGHTRTLWNLLERHHIPVFVFVNKMDAAGADRRYVMRELGSQLSAACVDFSDPCAPQPAEREDVALLDGDDGISAVDEFLECGRLSNATLRSMVAGRKVFPCYFGSALRLRGVDEFLDGIAAYMCPPSYGEEFGARVFKVSHDRDGSRLTWVKITGGSLPVKSVLDLHAPQQAVSSDLVSSSSMAGRGSYREKIDQIRLYDGVKFELAPEAPSGTICALTGLEHTYPGQGMGFERDGAASELRPVLTYRVVTQPGQDLHKVIAALHELEDEDPSLRVRWVARLNEIQVQLMGPVQIDVLCETLRERYGIEVTFNKGGVLYLETVTACGEGIGHFEPLRHYAEVHLELRPGQRGSGLVFDSQCGSDALAGNWQHLVLTHLREKEHAGVLIGAPITDMRISLIAGRGHEKHTEGGDFREATYRAVRQGLMQLRSRGKCMLLEPWYRFSLRVGQTHLGRAMSDVERMGGRYEAPEADGDEAILEGYAPVESMSDYAMEVNVYTHGKGSLECVFSGYEPCHNADEVIASAGYDPEQDMDNIPDSVFCAHGSGYAVKWNRVPDFAHVDALGGADSERT